MNDCKCKVCGKEFEYGDENSPMLTDKKWRRVVNFYNLKGYEERAKRLYTKYAPYPTIWNAGEIEDRDEWHLYICSDCMEKALGRKILPSDLMTAVPFNKAFEDYYFNQNKEI